MQHRPSRGVHVPVRLATLTAAAFFALFACSSGDDGTGPAPTHVTVTLTPTSVTIFVGETASLTATVTGSTSSATFASSSTSVATVSSTGTVTAVSPGSATITAAVGTATATAQVVVSPSTITLDAADLEVQVGGTAQLTATVTGGTGHTVSWASSNAAVATVDDAGLVSGVAEGSATVTASVDGQQGVEATAAITVTATPPSATVVAVTQNGQAVDPNDVSGVIEVVVQVEVPTGFAGAVEVLLGEKVAGSAPIGGGGADAPLRIAAGLRDEFDVPVPVSTVSAELIDGLPTPDFTNELLTLTPRVVDGSGGVVIRGTAHPGGLRLNNRPMVVIDGVVVTGNSFPDARGFDWQEGDVQARATYLGFDGSRVERIEVVTNGAETVYGSDAVAGVVNFVLKKDTDPPMGIGGLEGELFFEGAKVIPEGGGSPVDVPIGNNIPGAFSTDVFPNYEVEPLWIDNAGATSSVQLQTESFYVNDKWQLNDHWSFNLGFRFEADANGPATVTDAGSGLADCDWGGSFTPLDPNFAVITQTLDIGDTNGTDFYMQARCFDHVHNESRFHVRDFSGSPVGIGTDFILPELFYDAADPNAIQQWAVNPTRTEFVYGIDDPPNSFGSASGARTDGLWLSVDRNFPDATPEDRCVTGTFANGVCEREYQGVQLSGRYRITDQWTLTGNYTLSAQGEDEAGNLSAALLQNMIVDREAPFYQTQITGPSSLPGGSLATFSTTIQDDLDIVDTQGFFGFADEFFFGDADVLTENERFDQAVDDALRVLAELDDEQIVIPGVQRVSTSGPFPSPTGPIIPATDFFFAAADAGGNVADQRLDVTSLVTPRTSSFGAGGLDYWDIQATVQILCADPSHPECSGVPAEGGFTVEGRIPDNGNPFPISRARVFQEIPRLGGGTQLAPVGDDLELTIQDNGGWFQYFFVGDLSGSDFHPCVTGVAGIGFDDDNNALVPVVTPLVVKGTGADCP